MLEILLKDEAERDELSSGAVDTRTVLMSVGPAPGISLTQKRLRLTLVEARHSTDIRKDAKLMYRAGVKWLLIIVGASKRESCDMSP